MRITVSNGQVKNSKQLAHSLAKENRKISKILLKVSTIFEKSGDSQTAETLLKISERYQAIASDQSRTSN